MVMVTDERGEQLPAFGGRYEDVAARILEEAPEGATFAVGKWGTGGMNHVRVAVSRTAWSLLGNHS